MLAYPEDYCLMPPPADLAAAQKAWSTVLDQLQLQMTRATFDTWLRGSQVVAQRDRALTVAVRHTYGLDWIQGRLLPVIQRTVHRVVGPDTTVEFVASPKGANPCGASPAGASREEARSASPESDAAASLDRSARIGDLGIEAVREERGAGATSLVWTDFYIKFKVAFRKKALRALKGAKLSVFLCLALHVDRHRVAKPGIESIMRETGYSRGVVCSALDELETLGLVTKLSSRRGTDQYQLKGYAWFGTRPAPSLWEEERPAERRN